MAKANSLNGKDLMLWIDGKVVALSTSCTLNMSVSTMDSATKDDGIWGSTEVGSMAWDCSNESVDSADASRTNDQVFDDLFDLYVAHNPIDITIGVPTNKSDSGVPEAGWTAGASGVYKGKAMITSLSRKGAKGSNGSVSISLTGVGALTKA